MIGVFDSGVGGLAVLKTLRDAFPTADFVYFGDTANAPYGPRSESEIATLCAGSLRRLYALGARDIIVACNSATVALRSHPPELLRTEAFEVLDMLTPALASAKPFKRIVYFGTQATTNSLTYARAFKEHGIEALGIALTNLASAIEEGTSENKIESIIADGVSQVKEFGPDAVVLACTHYPLVKKQFENVLKQANLAIPVLDPAESVRELTRLLFKTDGSGDLHIIFSKETAAAEKLVEQFFGKDCSVEIKPTLFGTFNLHFG